MCPVEMYSLTYLQGCAGQMRLCGCLMSAVDLHFVPFTKVYSVMTDLSMQSIKN